ncbi:MAG: hypothetical protein LCH51_03810 [Bacteroidetes bacterium]|nr:hypothetical protein [Bacteroidota bacterium]
MHSTDHIQAELAAISELLANANSKGRPYAVPEGYFERLPMIMLLKIGQLTASDDSAAAETESLSPLLAGLNKKMPFAVPEGYFAQEAVQPGLLDRLEKKMPYQVPVGYFDGFPDKMLATVTGQQKGGAKIVSFGRPWMRYAAAAAIVAVVAVSGWFYMHKTTNVADFGKDNGDVAAQLQHELNQLSDDAILEYNDSPAADGSANVLAANDDELNATDIHFLLEDVSDNALQDFLNLEKPGKDAILHN